jgi:uncharacterized protein YukE
LTQLVCPLCGRFVSLAHFDPSGFDSDIYAVEVQGLGRGRGVKVVGQHSILQRGDATIELIKNRILELSGVLLESGCLKPEEVVSSLKIKTVEPTEARRLAGEVETLEAELEEVRGESGRWRQRAETLDATLKEVNARYAGALTQLREKESELVSAYEEIGDMIDSVEDALTASGQVWTWSVDEAEDPVQALKERIGDLIREFESLAAEAEKNE